MEKTFPTLYARASTGKIKWWRIEVRSGPAGPLENAAQILIWYGYVGQDEDKTQMTVRWVHHGKNIGRANQTTPFEQACLEADAFFEKKRDKKYSEDPSGESRILLPMLAHDFTKRGHDIEWPSIIQPKLDGVRCLAHKVSASQMEYISRGGKRFETLDLFSPFLLARLDVGDVLDGEVYIHDVSLQEIVSIVKRAKTAHPDRDKLEYWVYDFVAPDKTFEERYHLYWSKLLHEDPSVPIHPLGVIEVDDEAHAWQHHDLLVEGGYEGAILRNKSGLYKPDFRSADLQKLKRFQDQEFVIVGGKEGTGRAAGTITFTCLTADGKEFDVRPRGDDAQRRLWWETLEQCVGKMLTVRFFYFTDDGIPYLPVGIALRTYEG